MTKVSYFRTVFGSTPLTPAVLAHSYAGSGTATDPFVCVFVPVDDGNPNNWSSWRKWTITMAAAGTVFVVSFCSSDYTAAMPGLMAEFGVSQITATLGLALFLIGYILGPLVWGPLSEVYGRRSLMIGTLGCLTAFNAGAAGAGNMTALLVCRFVGSIFGSSPMTNAGGTIADLFPAAERGVPVAIFAAGPFLGPVLGPIVGGFTAEYAGWRWVLWAMTLVSALFWVVGTLLIPETYAPYILARRAEALEKETGKVFRTPLQLAGPRPTAAQAVRTAASRPWVLLCEPIVAIMSIYMAIVYGTLYMMFGAFPLVYQQARGWSPGEGGLAFLGLLVGIAGAIGLILPYDKYCYAKAKAEAPPGHGGMGAPPEARLPPGIVGSVLLPIGLFWFAWTNGPETHWVCSILATIPFGAGMILIFFSLTQYLIDTYTIYAASVIAGSGILRSLFGAAFPLFTTNMYRGIGIHWASSVPGFLSLACLPFPFLFWKYGAAIRNKCKYSRQAAEAMKKIM